MRLKKVKKVKFVAKKKINEPMSLLFFIVNSHFFLITQLDGFIKKLINCNFWVSFFILSNKENILFNVSVTIQVRYCCIE